MKRKTVLLILLLVAGAAGTGIWHISQVPACAYVTDYYPMGKWPLVFEVQVTSGYFLVEDNILIEGVEAVIVERAPIGNGKERWRLLGGDTICPWPDEPIPNWMNASITLDERPNYQQED